MEKLRKEICFLAKDNIYCNNKDGYKEIILSPYYYWYFEKVLPTSNIKRAKKILPQMLMSSLPQSTFEYIIVAKKDDKNKFDIYVLDIVKIKEKLNSFNISFDNVSAVALSHIEFKNSEILLDNGKLICENNSCFEIDSLKNIETTLEKKSIGNAKKDIKKLSYKYSFGNGTFIQKAVDIIDNSFISLVFILSLFLTGLTINYYGNSNIISKYEVKHKNLLDNQKFAEHQVQLNYIMDNLLDVDSVQKNFRNKLKIIINLKSTTAQYIHSIEYDENYWYLKVSAKSQDDATKFVKKLNLSFIKKENSLFIYESKR